MPPGLKACMVFRRRHGGVRPPHSSVPSTRARQTERECPCSAARSQAAPQLAHRLVGRATRPPGRMTTLNTHHRTVPRPPRHHRARHAAERSGLQYSTCSMTAAPALVESQLAGHRDGVVTTRRRSWIARVALTRTFILSVCAPAKTIAAHEPISRLSALCANCDRAGWFRRASGEPVAPRRCRRATKWTPSPHRSVGSASKRSVPIAQ